MAKKASDRYESPAELLAVLQSLKAVEEPGKETEAAADDEQEELVTDDAASSSRRDTVLEQKSPTGSQPARESESAKGRYVGTRRAPPTPARKVLEPEPAPKKSKPSIKKTDKDHKLAYVVVSGIGIIVVLVMVLVAVIRPKTRARDESAERPAPAPPPIVAVDPPKITDPPKVIPDPPVLVAKPKYPALYKPAVAVDAARLRQETLGPWNKLPAFPADAPTLRVVRIADGLPQTYTSLAAACAAAPDKGAIIEIHDNGPLYETGAVISGKRLLIRGALGYRPLIVWDVLRTLDELKLKKITQPQPFTFLSGQKANLTLEGLEIVMRWPETAIPGSITLVQNHEGDVSLRNCVFSFKGPTATAITLVRITGGAGARTGPDSGPVRCRVSGCYARCSTLTALDLQAPTSDVLVEDSLLAGDSRPLLRLKAATGSPTNLRLARSTLICGANLLNVQPASAGEDKLALQVLVWDSLLSRSRVESGGELALVPGDTGSIKWQAVNSLYTGWRVLLGGNKTPIQGTDLAGWKRLWNRTEGDVSNPPTWPSPPFQDLEDKPAAKFRQEDSKDPSVCFASSTDMNKPLGCDLTQLPFSRDNWIALTQGVALPPLDPLTDAAPPIDAPQGDLYTGERLLLDPQKIPDLGKYLDEKQRMFKFAPRVTIHLVGSGEHKMSPCASARARAR